MNRVAAVIFLLFAASPAYARGTAGIGWAILTIPLVWPVILFVLALKPSKRKEIESGPLPILLLIFLVMIVSPLTVGLAHYLARSIGASVDLAALVLLLFEVGSILAVFGYRKVAARWSSVNAKNFLREPTDT